MTECAKIGVLTFERIAAVADTNYSNQENMNMNAFELIKASVDEARMKSGRNVTYIDRILARAGVKLEVRPDNTIGLAELDRAMSAANMNVNERVQVKNALMGLGLLAQ